MDMEGKCRGRVGMEWPGPAHSECLPFGAVMGSPGLTLRGRGGGGAVRPDPGLLSLLPFESSPVQLPPFPWERWDDPRLPSGPNQHGRQRAKESRMWTLWARGALCWDGASNGEGSLGHLESPPCAAGLRTAAPRLLLFCLELLDFLPLHLPFTGSGFWAQQPSPVPALRQLEGIGRWLLALAVAALASTSTRLALAFLGFLCQGSPYPLAAP